MTNIFVVTIPEVRGIATIQERRTVSDFPEYEDYYAYNLERGITFQDYVLRALQVLGWVFINYSSKYFQFRVGENSAGIEIKYDSLMCSTGNLYVETGEKRPDRTWYVPSGICKVDNSIFYVIGDYSTFFLFTKRELLRLYERNQTENLFRTVEQSTTKGILIPMRVAHQVALKVVINNPSSLQA